MTGRLITHNPLALSNTIRTAPCLRIGIIHNYCGGYDHSEALEPFGGSFSDLAQLLQFFVSVSFGNQIP